MTKSRSSKKEFGTYLFQDLIFLGKIRTVFGSLLFGALSVYLISMGIIKLQKNVNLTSSVKSTSIGSVTCNPVKVSNTGSSTNNIVDYNCTLTNITFKVNGINYTIQNGVINSNSDMTVNTPVTVYYDPSNPNNNSLTPDNSHQLGIGLLVGGGILLFLILINLIFTFKSGTYAAASGISQLFMIF